MVDNTSLPKAAAKRLSPYVQRGIEKGMWSDDSTVVELFNNKSSDPSLTDTILELGGLKSEIAIQFVTDAVLVDLTDILRRTPYEAFMEIWEVTHTVIPSTGRPACFISGAAIVKDDQGEMEAAMFNMSLWDADAALGDVLERDGVYRTNVTCKDLERDVLLLDAISGLTVFKKAKKGFGNRADLLKATFEITPIAELEDNLSRGMFDFRLVEATIVFCGTQPTKAGGQFGRMMMRDDSSLENIDSDDGELILSGITSTDIATRFGKYSKVLALLTVSESAKYGLNANIKSAEAIILVAPTVAAVSNASGDDDADDAGDYFGSDDIEEVVLEDEEVDDSADEQVDTSAGPIEVEEEAKAEAPATADDDDDWIDDEDEDWDDEDEAEDEPEEESPTDESESPPTMTIAEAKAMSVADLRAFCRKYEIKVKDLSHARKGEILDALDDAGLLE